MLEKLPASNLEFDISDYEDEDFYPLLSQLPTPLAKKHVSVIEAGAFSNEEAISYLESILNKRNESLNESTISDNDLKENMSVPVDSVFQSLETGVFNSTENYLGQGMTARVKHYSVPTKNGDLELAIKYVITPTEKTITAEQEHNVLKEVERMRALEAVESRFEKRSKYIRVPHPYLHHKSKKLQCYGMEKINGLTLEQAVLDSVPEEFIERLRNSQLANVDNEELMGYVERFFDTMHEQYLHGDMKAANMMVSEDGILYVIDFGQSISAGNIPSGADEQFENLKQDEINIAKKSIQALLRKIATSN